MRKVLVGSDPDCVMRVEKTPIGDAEESLDRVRSRIAHNIGGVGKVGENVRSEVKRRLEPVSIVQEDIDLNATCLSLLRSAKEVFREDYFSEIPGLMEMDGMIKGYITLHHKHWNMVVENWGKNQEMRVFLKSPDSMTLSREYSQILKFVYMLHNKA